MEAASIMRRICVFFLVFILGFMFCAGALVGGGYLLYSKLTLDRLGVNTDSVLSEDADVDLSAMSLKGLFAEISAIKGTPFTIDLLVNRYGLILPESLDNFLTEDLKKQEIGKLFSREGLKDLLSGVYFGKLFGYEQKDNPDYSIWHPENGDKLIWVDPNTGKRVIGINAVLADITLSEFLDGGLPTQKIMDELTVGELMELNKKTGLPVFVQGEDGTLTPAEDMDPITVWYDKDGNEVSSVVAALADKTVSELTTGLGDVALGEILGTVEYKEKTYTYEVRRTLDEHILLTEAESVIGEFSDLSIDGLTGGQVNDRVNNVEIYTLLGYKQDAQTGKWTDSEGKPLNAIMSQLATSKVGELNDTVDGLHFGDIAELVPVGEDGEVIEDLEAYEGTVTWYEKGYEKGAATNVLADGLRASFAALSVKEMNNSDTLSNAVKDIAVGDAMGYVKKDGVWYTDDTCTTEASGIMATLADKKVGNMSDEVDKITFSEVAELVAVDGNGDVIEDPDTYEGDFTWYEKGYEKGADTNEAASSIMIALAGLAIGDMSDDGALTDAIGDVVVGEALGYERALDENGKEIWLTKDVDEGTGKRKPAKGIMAVLADYKVTELNEKVDDITLGEVSGFEAREEPDPEDATKTVTVWYDENGEVATGVTGALANLTVANMSDEKALSDEIKKVTVGDALGYEKVDGIWYTEYDKNDPTKNRVTGLTRAIADERVGNMDNKAKNVTLAEVADLIAVDSEGNILEDVDAATYDGIWYEEYYGKDNVNNKPTTGLMAGIAHLKLSDMQDSDTVKDAVGKIKTGDAMGYEKVDGIWYTAYDKDHPENHRLTGIVKAMADSPVGELNDDLQAMKFGTVAGLAYDSAAGKWVDENNEDATGINAALADLTVGKMSDPEALSAAVQKVTVADAMNYTPDGHGGYKKEKGDPVEGFMAVIAGKQISEIQGTLDTAEIGEFMGYERKSENGNQWEKDGVVAGALMQKVCSEKMDGLGTFMDNLTIGDVIPEPDGLMAYVAPDTKVTELDAAFKDLFTDETNGITIGELKSKGLIPASIHAGFDGYTFASFMQYASSHLTPPPTTP